jgi:hypothetical protein
VTRVPLLVLSLERWQGEVCKAQCESILVGGNDGAIAYWDLNMSDKKIIQNDNNSKRINMQINTPVLFQHKGGIRKGMQKNKLYGACLIMA